MEEKKYMNPYLAGALLGLLLLATIYITGRGLGASGAVKSVTVELFKQLLRSMLVINHFIQNI